MNPTKLNTAAQIRSAKKSFHAVFNNSNTVADPFDESIQKKMILFYHLRELDKTYFRALLTAAREIGEQGLAYLSIIDGYKAEKNFEIVQAAASKLGVSNDDQYKKIAFEACNHWMIDLGVYPYDILLKEETEKGIGWTPLSRSAIYSSEGQWGIMFSHGGKVLIGGPSIFLEALKKKIPTLKDEVYEFLDDQKNIMERDPVSREIITSWLPTLMIQIYGFNEAKAMFESSGLSAILDLSL